MTHTDRVLTIAKLGVGQENYYLAKVACGIEDYYTGVTAKHPAHGWVAARRASDSPVTCRALSFAHLVASTPRPGTGCPRRRRGSRGSLAGTSPSAR